MKEKKKSKPSFTEAELRALYQTLLKGAFFDNRALLSSACDKIENYLAK